MNRIVPTDRVLEKLDDYLSKNDYTAAKRHLAYWLNEAENSGDGRAGLIINNELMGLCRKLGEKDEALSFAKSALDLVEKMNIQNNIGAATTYLNSATVYKAFGMAEKAIPLFEKAKKIYEQNLLPSDDRLGGLYNNMALALVDLNRFDEADALYKKAISVMQNKMPEQAITYLNMASAAEVQFGLEGAEELISTHIQKAMKLLDLCKNQTDGNYAFVCEKCASVFGYYGYFDYENQLKERCRRIYERT